MKKEDLAWRFKRYELKYMLTLEQKEKIVEAISSVGSKKNVSLSTNGYLVVGIGSTTATIKMPVSLSAVVIVLGDNSPSIKTEASTSEALDENGVAWN